MIKFLRKGQHIVAAILESSVSNGMYPKSNL